MIRRRSNSIVLGAAAVICALAAQWLLHRVNVAVPFPPYSAGNWLIRHTPGSIATRSIDSLGKEAKPALAATVAIGLLVVGAAIGHRRWTPAFVALATISAALLDPIDTGFGAVALAASAGALAAVLPFAVNALSPRSAGVRSGRREFLGLVAGSALLVAISASRVGWGSSRPRSAFQSDRLQPFVRRIDPSFKEVEGLSAAITSPADHYVVDINFEPPIVDDETWALAIDATGTAATRLSLQEILTLAATEQPVFLECVSNYVGGPLASNGLWSCIPLADVLGMSGRSANGHRTILAHAFDGYSAAIPSEHVDEVVLAFAMSGETIPRRHGFPVRLLWPGRYGMLSVKWLTRLELIDEPADGFWAARGWDRDGLLKTGSRIDTPERAAHVSVPLTIAGVAWGQRGISRVEVSTDDEASWQEAQVEEAISELSWRRWQTSIDVPEGKVQLAVRAFDGDGELQPTGSQPPHPSGASGIHHVEAVREGG
ncbi:MAG: molybdopterin-dependent oxidoreductase [bacterium]